MPTDRFLKSARAIQAILWLVSAGAVWPSSPRFAAGILLGGLLMAINLLAIAQLVKRCRQNQTTGGLTAALLGGKLMLLLLGLAGIIEGLTPDLTALALGLATFFGGLLGALGVRYFFDTNTQAGTRRFGSLI